MYRGSFLKIIDNTGGNRALCVKIFSNSELGRPGNVVLVVVKSILINRKITYRKRKRVGKGTVRTCLLLRVAYTLKRKGGVHIKFSTIGVALVGRWDLPIGSRVYGPVAYESRVQKYIRISMLGEGSF